MKKYNISQRFNIIVVSILCITIFINLIVMGFAMLNITSKVSQGYAKMYASEIAHVIETHLSREIGLSLKLARTPSIIEWIANEDQLSKKLVALEEINSFIDLLHDHNMFIVMDRSKNIYFPEQINQQISLEIAGVISKDIKEDSWYFDTINSDELYNINIDKDRFLDTYRVWINVKVEGPDGPVGVIGTGLYLDYFINENISSNKDKSAYTLIINKNGDIQLDGTANRDYEAYGYSSVYNFINEDRFNAELKESLVSEQSETILKIQNDNYDYAAVSSIKDTNWYVITFYTNGTFYTSNNLLLFIIMMVISIIAIIIVINIFIKHIFLKPFMLLIQSLQNKNIYLSEELFGTNRKDEFGLLSNTIEQMADRLVSSIPIGLFLIDSDFNLIYSNLNFISQFAAKDKEALKSTFKETPELIFANPEDFQRFKSILTLKEKLVVIEMQFVKFTGEVFWGEIHIQYRADNALSHFYEGILLNTQNKKDYESKLINLASTDSLTGLLNRHKFNELVIEEIERSERYGGPLSMMIFDLDHFKRVNDTYGHIVGDDVLVETSRLAKEILRTTDIIARWGGEEFSILLPGTTSEGGYIAAEKLRKKLETHLHSTAGIVTASFGVSQKRTNEDYTQWFTRVDQALFNSKNSGRNTVTVSEDQSDENTDNKAT